MKRFEKKGKKNSLDRIGMQTEGLIQSEAVCLKSKFEVSGFISYRVVFS